MSACCTLHEVFLLPACSHIFIAWFSCVPNYTVDKFLKRKRIWKEQTSQRQGQQLSWKRLLFLQRKLKHNYASDVAAIPFHYLCASIESFCSFCMEVPKSSFFQAVPAWKNLKLSSNSECKYK